MPCAEHPPRRSGQRGEGPKRPGRQPPVTAEPACRGKASAGSARSTPGSTPGYVTAAGGAPARPSRRHTRKRDTPRWGAGGAGLCDRHSALPKTERGTKRLLFPSARPGAGSRGRSACPRGRVPRGSGPALGQALGAHRRVLGETPGPPNEASSRRAADETLT